MVNAMTENVPNLMEDKNLQIHKPQSSQTGSMQRSHAYGWQTNEINDESWNQPEKNGSLYRGERPHIIANSSSDTVEDRL
jgi:hypothetical protein